MHILALADEPVQRLWGEYGRETLKKADLILSAGDLPASYLSYMTCFSSAPVVYIHGNHDAGYEKKPPEGCVCVEDTIYTVNGLRVLGLGGSMKYRPAPNMFTERQMAARACRLWWKLRRSKGFHILLTHDPDDLAFAEYHGDFCLFICVIADHDISTVGNGISGIGLRLSGGSRGWSVRLKCSQIRCSFFSCDMAKCLIWYITAYSAAKRFSTAPGDTADKCLAIHIQQAVR